MQLNLFVISNYLIIIVNFFFKTKIILKSTNFFFNLNFLNIKSQKTLNFLDNNELLNSDEYKNNFSCFFFSFLTKYFQNKSRKNIFFFLKKLSFSSFFLFDNSYTDLLTYLEKKFKKYQLQIGRGFFLKEFFECFIFFLFFKDATFFSNWFKRTCERIDFKKHKKFFYFLSVFFSKYFFFFFKPYGVSGFRLSVAGKISLTGSAKKKSFLLRVGSFSSVKKSLKMSYTSNFVWTSQGALGFKVGLFFN